MFVVTFVTEPFVLKIAHKAPPLPLLLASNGPSI